MRTIVIKKTQDSKYIIIFLAEGEQKWQIISYVLLNNLPEIIYEWIEKGEHPVYQYV